MVTLNGRVAFTVASSPLNVWRPGMFVVLMSSGLWASQAPSDTVAQLRPGRAAPRRTRSPIACTVPRRGPQNLGRDRTASPVICAPLFRRDLLRCVFLGRLPMPQRARAVQGKIPAAGARRPPRAGAARGAARRTRQGPAERRDGAGRRVLSPGGTRTAGDGGAGPRCVARPRLHAVVT